MRLTCNKALTRSRVARDGVALQSPGSESILLSHQAGDGIHYQKSSSMITFVSYDYFDAVKITSNTR